MIASDILPELNFYFNQKYVRFEGISHLRIISSVVHPLGFLDRYILLYCPTSIACIPPLSLSLRPVEVVNDFNTCS